MTDVKQLCDEGETMLLFANVNLTRCIVRAGVYLAIVVFSGCAGLDEPPKTVSHPAPDTARVPAPSAPDSLSSPARPSVFLRYPCAEYYRNGFHPVAGRNRTPVPAVPRPPKGKVIADPVYRTCVVRVTDAEKEPPDTFARNDYSRRQPFNADDSLILVYAYNGAWHLYDARTLEYVKKLRGPGGDAEPQWHPTNPNILYYLPNNGGMTIYELDIRSDRRAIKADFTQPDSRGFSLRSLWPTAARVWTRSEGSPSADYRYWAFMVEDNDFHMLGLISYDMQTNTILGTYSSSVRPDHTSMSPTGDYVVVTWARDSREAGPTVFNRDLSNRQLLVRRIGHSDVALDMSGEDVLVSVDDTSGHVFMTKLRTRETTQLYGIWPNNTTMAMHFSGKAYKKPGWVLVSTYGAGRTEWPHQKVFALELKPNPAIVNLMHHHNSSGSYFAEPQAAVNRDFTRFVVNSNWGTPGHDHIDVYMVEIPARSF
jgi:Tol biopolymer transport system component